MRKPFVWYLFAREFRNARGVCVCTVRNCRESHLENEILNLERVCDISRTRIFNRHQYHCVMDNGHRFVAWIWNKFKDRTHVRPIANCTLFYCGSFFFSPPFWLSVFFVLGDVSIQMKRSITEWLLYVPITR